MTRGFRAGDWVEIRPLSDIMKTLDGQGTLEGLPFMPEMARYCGQRFKIAASAHKTCDPTGMTDMRRMKDAVHLETRCDGSFHDGCEARCRLYWKTAWLIAVDGPAARPVLHPSAADVAALMPFTSYQTEAGVRYRCQGTEIVRATMPGKNLAQYAKDIRSGNITFSYFLRNMMSLWGKAIQSRLARFRRTAPAPAPRTESAMTMGGAKARLDLMPGEFVRVRSAGEIAQTLEEKRGPALEPEMLRHCGTRHRVLYRVNRVIDERSGKMLKLRNDCVVLDNIACSGLDNKARLFCPRACYYFWREAWLERADTATSPAFDSSTAPPAALDNIDLGKIRPHASAAVDADAVDAPN